MQTLHASFLQEKHLKILAQPVTARGMFAFQAPGSLRWEYVYPVHSLLLKNGEKLQKFTEQDGELSPDPTLPPKAQFLVLEELTNWLAGRFEANPAFAVAFPDPATVILAPRNRELVSILTRIEVRLARDTGLIDTIIINESPDSRTRLSFSDQELNQPLPGTLFTRP